MANFEAFRRVISSSINHLFLKSVREGKREQRKTRVPVDFMESSHKPTICPHQPIFKAAEDAVYFVVFGLVYTCVCSKPSFDFHKNNDDCSVFPPITSNNCCE